VNVCACWSSPSCGCAILILEIDFLLATYANMRERGCCRYPYQHQKPRLHLRSLLILSAACESGDRRKAAAKLCFSVCYAGTVKAWTCLVGMLSDSSALLAGGREYRRPPIGSTEEYRGWYGEFIGCSRYMLVSELEYSDCSCRYRKLVGQAIWGRRDCTIQNYLTALALAASLKYRH